MNIHIYIPIFLSRISSIILHCFIHHAFGSGWMLHAKLVFYHPALLCHSILLGKTTQTLFTTWEGIDFIYIYIPYILFNSFIYHSSLLYQFMLLGRGGCCMSHFSFIILHCPLIPYYWEKLPYSYSLLWEGVYFIYIDVYTNFVQSSLLSSFMSLPLRISEECHSTTHSFLKGLTSHLFH